MSSLHTNLARDVWYAGDKRLHSLLYRQRVLQLDNSLMHTFPCVGTGCGPDDLLRGLEQLLNTPQAGKLRTEPSRYLSLPHQSGVLKKQSGCHFLISSDLRAHLTLWKARTLLLSLMQGWLP
jgi:hypothetical protein